MKATDSRPAPSSSSSGRPESSGGALSIGLLLVPGATPVAALEILQGAGDCDGDWQLDTCQIASGQLADCNANGVPDSCDLAAGTSVDVNGNGIPDESEPMTVWHVDAGAPPGGDGSAASPFQTLGRAFSAAISGDEISVAPGTYVGAANRGLSFAGRTSTSTPRAART